MSTHLAINGIDLDTLFRTDDVTVDDLGDSARALDGSWVGSQITTKRVWTLQSVLLTRNESDAWLCLLNGRGHVWRFTDQYSVKGLAASASSGTITYNAASGKFDKKVQVAATSYVRWTPTGVNALTSGGLNPRGCHTLTVWRLETGVWHHYVVVYDGTTYATWKDGASLGTSALAFAFVHSSGYVQLGDGTNADDFSDLVVLPCAAPSTWPALLYVTGRAFPSLPRLEASGEMLSAPTTPLSVRVLNIKANAEPFTDTTYQQGGRRIVGTMVEC